MSAPRPPALVLTAGLGTRLRPLTDLRAKPAVPVAGRPLVVRILEWLAGEGVTDVVLNLHHRPETITRVVGYGGGGGLRVRYTWEPAILGSAGGPRQAAALLGPRFFIVNGDTLTAAPLGPLAAAHRRTGAAVTLAVTRPAEPGRYGGVRVDADGRARGFTRAGADPPRGDGTGRTAHFIGVQLVEASVFARLPAGQPAATIGGLYDDLAASTAAGRPAPIRAHQVDAPFIDVGTPADYLAAAAAIAAREGRPAIPIGAGTTVHATAVLDDTIVWDRAVISAGCRLTGCIVADDVTLPPDTVLRRQICLPAAGRQPAGRDRVIGTALVTPVDRPPRSGA